MTGAALIAEVLSCVYYLNWIHLKIIRTIILLLTTLAWPAAPLFGSPVDDWDVFERAVCRGTIAKKDAKLRLAPLLGGVSSYLTEQYRFDTGPWVFPLEGYGLRALDGSDYRPRSYYGPYGVKGYDFFDGNRHGGHPACDLFIRDKNQDSLDDTTGKPVRALALADGVCVFISTGWVKGSDIRSGNCVKLYNPAENRFFYYAHLNKVSVQVGEFVKKGNAVGTVGRTGALAARKTSPTHVHLMIQEYKKGTLLPVNYYEKLKEDTKGKRVSE